MVELDAILDQAPTTADVMEMANTRIRNLMCFRELESFNNTGKFLNKHTFIIHKTDREQIEELYRSGDFLEEYYRCQENVKRYSSYLRSKKFNAAKQENHQQRLTEHSNRLAIFKDILLKNRAL